MKILHAGHRYELAHIDGINTTVVQFVNKESGTECEGTTTQEILRMLIDRTRYCNNCLPHRVNEEIIYHFRKALILHESRALERQCDKGQIDPEIVSVGRNGHFGLGHRGPIENETLYLEPAKAWSQPNSKPTYR